MKYLTIYYIAIAALVSVVVPQVSAGSGRIYFPGDEIPNFHGTTTGKPGDPNGSDQCVLTSLPPDPQSGCCGRQAVDNDRITAVDANDTAMSFGTRISGGEETELTQYPWTVYLQITVSYEDKPDASFECGGGLISGNYVLTAAHCLSISDGVLKSVTVHLAEHDKRTFPQDCKLTSNGRECVENVKMSVENIIIHPQYKKQYNDNDIALIKLRGTAPYTQYIRPICLPTIDIESPNFLRPQFAVAGWGRNGEYSSNIKQDTVLNLVNREVCKNDYPFLTQGHLCAAGNNGADSCKGDSGGPLMILYNGRYYVSGIVSSKRSDFKCGSTMPTLYTNVYHYLDWIRNNIL